MNVRILCVSALVMLLSCERNALNHGPDKVKSLQGTWLLITGTTIQKNDTTHTDYQKGQRMIKIINDTHFAFLNHDLNHGKDSTSAMYVAGGGRYTLTGDQYTEHLEYCNFREWEDKTFHFTVTLKSDTLVQRGIEKIEETGIDREIIETYIRLHSDSVTHQ
ncbi:lipocalin-like domain-containing protein [Ohtaekwangia koreensis]|nr:lipocalin-like domain-containing protein [Ohtaekwangia koreensis]